MYIPDKCDLMLELITKLANNKIFPQIHDKRLIDIYNNFNNKIFNRGNLIWEYIKQNSVLSNIEDLNNILEDKLNNEISSKYYIAYDAIFSSPKLSSVITIFSGGSGSNSIVSGLIDKIDNGGQINLLINAYDDGKSTGDIKKKLNILGPSDIAKNLGVLIIKKKPELKKLLNYRLKKNSFVTVRDLINIIQNEKLLLEDGRTTLTLDQQKIIKLWISTFIERVIKWEKENNKIWNLSDYALRNIIYVGAYYNNKENHTHTIQNIIKIFDLSGNIILNSPDMIYLVGLTESNKFLDNEDSIVNKYLDENIYDVYMLSKNQYELVKNFSAEERIKFLQETNQLTIDEERELNNLETVDDLIEYLKLKSIIPLPTKESINSINKADLLCFAPTTIHSSLIPTLKTYGIKGALSKSNVPIIFIGNFGLERGDYDLADQLELVQKICFLNNLAYKYVIISNHGLTNESYLYKGEELNYLPIDLNKIRTLGLEPIELSIKEIDGTHSPSLVSNIMLSLLNLNKKGLGIYNGRIVQLSESINNNHKSLSQLLNFSRKPFLYDIYKDKIEKLALDIQNCKYITEYHQIVKKRSQAKVIILAAGNSTRLKFRPKALYPINDTPNIEYILRATKDFDTKPIVLINSKDIEYFKVWEELLLKKTSREIFLIPTGAFGSGGSLLYMQDKIKFITTSEETNTIILIWGDITNIKSSSILKCLLIHSATVSTLTIPTCIKKRPYAGVTRDCFGNVIDFFQTKQMLNKDKPEFGEHDGSFFILNEKKMWQYLNELNNEQVNTFNSKDVRFEKIVSSFSNANELVTAVPLLENNETLGFNTKAEANLIAKNIRIKSIQYDLDLALSKLYNALVLDVDGTITNEEKQVPEEIIDYIISKARKNIPIGIISARNKDSLEKILLDKLGDTQNIYIYYNASAVGIRLYDRKILYERHSLSEDLIIKSLEILKWGIPIKYTYKCSSHKIQLWIKNISLEKVINLIKIINFLFKENLISLTAYLSNYDKNMSSIIITDSSKKFALDHFIKHHKISINKIAKIADMGSKYGIDHGMLLGHGAFSVKECDNETSQIQIRNILSQEGLPATMYILKKLNLVARK